LPPTAPYHPPSIEAAEFFDSNRPHTPSPYLPSQIYASDAGQASQSSGGGESTISEVMQVIKSHPRKYRKCVLLSPLTSLEKKKPKVTDKSSERTVTFSIRIGMEQGKGGLLNFFNKLATEDDKRMTVALW
jgi:hypothetical protein